MRLFHWLFYVITSYSIHYTKLYEAFSRTIEHDLATRQLTFPTFLDLTIRIKRVCDDPNSTTDAVVNVIRPDALLSARIV